MRTMQEEYRQLDDKYARLNKEHKEQQVVKIQFKKKRKKEKGTHGIKCRQYVK